MEGNSAEEELNIPLTAAKIEKPDPVQNAKKPEDSGDSLPKDCDTVNSQEETYLAKSNSKLDEVRTCLSKEDEGELSSEYESADEEVENEEVNNEESLLIDNEGEEEDPVKEALKEEDKNDKEEEEREEDFIDEDYLKEQEASMSEEEKEVKIIFFAKSMNFMLTNSDGIFFDTSIMQMIMPTNRWIELRKMIKQN